MNNVYIDSDQLLTCALNIKKDATTILTTFQNECSQAITAGNECLQVSGLDSASINNALNKIFTNVYDQLMVLANFLVNNVVSEYDQTTEAIKKSFNVDFANQISSLLGIQIGTASSAVASASSGSMSSSSIKTPYISGDNDSTTSTSNAGNSNTSTTNNTSFATSTTSGSSTNAIMSDYDLVKKVMTEKGFTENASGNWVNGNGVTVTSGNAETIVHEYENYLKNNGGNTTQAYNSVSNLTDQLIQQKAKTNSASVSYDTSGNPYITSGSSTNTSTARASSNKTTSGTTSSNKVTSNVGSAATAGYKTSNKTTSNKTTSSTTSTNKTSSIFNLNKKNGIYDSSVSGGAHM